MYACNVEDNIAIKTDNYKEHAYMPRNMYKGHMNKAGGAGLRRGGGDG